MKKIITRKDAIRIFDMATDKDDPFWENVVQEWYDEETDNLPTLYEVFEALGVSREEFCKAVNEEPPNSADKVDNSSTSTNKRSVICSDDECNYCTKHNPDIECSVCKFQGRKLTPVS